MDTLLQTVHFLSSRRCLGRRSGTEGSRAAREYLIRELKQRGLQPLPQKPGYDYPLYDDGKQYAANIIGSLPGQGDLAEEYILLEAHYDHLGEDRETESYFPGANDNAAAVAVLLDLAFALQEKYQHSTDSGRRSLLIAFFDAEEPPFFASPKMGAHRFCEEPPLELNKIRLGIFLDLLGHPSIPCRALEKGIFLAGSEKTGLAEFIETVDPEDPFYLHRIGIHSIPPSGNYLAFKDRGLPFFFLTSGRAAYYHSTDDSAEKLDYPKLSKISSRLQQLTADLLTADAAYFEHDPSAQDDRASVLTLRRIAECISRSVPEADLLSIDEALKDMEKRLRHHQALDDLDRNKLVYMLGEFEKLIRH